MMPLHGGRRKQPPCVLVPTSTVPTALAHWLCACVQHLLPLELLRPVKVRVLHARLRVRCFIAAVVTVVFTLIFISYLCPTQSGIMGWLPWASAPCDLICPALSSGDIWRPVGVLSEHKCVQVASLPVPCPANSTSSDLLLMPPIEFLANYKAPCWYELLPLTNETTGNPYYRNLFTCFSPNARTLFLEMHAEWAVRAQLESNPWRLRCLPYFYIAGMPKCGSTDLYRKITQHPEVVRPPMKESHWWSKNRFGVRLNYSSLIPLDQYVDLFDKAALKIESHTVKLTSTKKQLAADSTKPFHPVVTGDASASTLWDNDDWWRLPENCGLTEPRHTNAHFIRRLTPHARILVILRQPTDRLFSDYLYFQKTNKSLAEFHEHVVLSVTKLKACLEQLSLRACVYDKRIASGVKVRLRVGIYHVYLAEWLKVFPREQILVIRLEDYAKRLKETTRQVYDFLGLRKLSREEEDEILDSPIANRRKKKDKELGFMWEDTRRILRDFYEPHNQVLAELLGDARFLWNDVHVPAREGPGNASLDHGDGDANRTKENSWDENLMESSASSPLEVPLATVAREPASARRLSGAAGHDMVENSLDQVHDTADDSLDLAPVNLDSAATDPGHSAATRDNQDDERYDIYEDDEYE